MDYIKRIEFSIQKHIGVGIRWDQWFYQLEIVISIMCFSVTLGFGKNLQD